MSDSKAVTASNGGNGPERESLWTARQTAKYLNVSLCWVYRRTETGEIPSAKLGGIYRYQPARVREYAERLFAGNVVELKPRAARVDGLRKGR